MVNSDNKTIKQCFSYPITATSGTTPANIQKMLDKNIISPVIESTTKVGPNSTSLQTTAGYKTDFQEFTIGTSKIIMPAQTYELEVTSSGNNYASKDQVTSYSANGNPLGYVSRDGISSRYVWGYNDRYMVIKTENIDSTALVSAIAASLPSGYSTLEALLNSFSTVPNTNWTNFNNSLRSNSNASAAMITTYTYKPLIGITSETAPNGTTTYYYYDSFGRLSEIKNDDGKLLKKYTYQNAN